MRPFHKLLPCCRTKSICCRNNRYSVYFLTSLIDIQKYYTCYFKFFISIISKIRNTLQRISLFCNNDHFRKFLSMNHILSYNNLQNTSSKIFHKDRCCPEYENNLTIINFRLLCYPQINSDSKKNRCTVHNNRF